MLTLFLIAGLVTAVLAICAGALISGVLLSLFKPTRLIAILFLVPVLGSIGALVGSWGSAWFANHFAGFTSLPFWAWIVGLIAGSVFGVTVGVIFTFLIVFPRIRRAT